MSDLAVVSDPASSTPVLLLGRLAAQCDLFAADPRTPPADRRDLERRAAAYRLQQMIEGDREAKEGEGYATEVG